MDKEIILTLIVTILTEIIIILLGKEMCNNGMMLAGCLYIGIFTVITGISSLFAIRRLV